MKWYKHDPSAALAGMIGLTVEERGAYYTLMDLQYARAPHNDVTDELVVKALGVRPHTWRRLKASLMAKGKVHEMNDGSITAQRVFNEVSTAIQNGLLGAYVEENQSFGSRAADQSGRTELESRVTSSFPTAARESEKRKKKKKNRTARSLATAPDGGALTREPKTVLVSPSLEEIVKAKGWAK